AACLIAAAIPAAVVVGIAFALPGITKNGQSTHVRWRDGLVFGIVLVVCAAIAAGIVVLVHGVGSGTVGNGGGRFASTSSNFRFTWWKEAWHGFTHHVLAGTGAGSFNLLNLLYRKSYLDFTIEPHDLPLQFLAELGVVGLV